MEPLTPEKIKSVLVAHEEEIAALKENTNSIETSLISLEEGQADIEKRLEKGDKRMDGIEGDVKELKSILLQSNSDRDRQHNELKEEIKSKEMGELKAELRRKNEEEAKSEARKWDLTKIFLAAIVGAIIGSVTLFMGAK